MILIYEQWNRYNHWFFYFADEFSKKQMTKAFATKDEAISYGLEHGLLERCSGCSFESVIHE